MSRTITVLISLTVGDDLLSGQLRLVKPRDGVWERTAAIRDGELEFTWREIEEEKSAQ